MGVLGVAKSDSGGRRAAEEGRDRHVQRLCEGDQVIDVAAALGAFDAGQHRVGHRPAESGDTSGKLTLREAALGAENLDVSGGPYSGWANFQ